MLGDAAGGKEGVEGKGGCDGISEELGGDGGGGGGGGGCVGRVEL